MICRLMKPLTESAIALARDQFAFEGIYVADRWIGSGRINDTRLVITIGPTGHIYRYILQRLNTDIFTKPLEVMENIAKVTEHLRKKCLERGGDPKRSVMALIPAKDGKPYWVSPEGDFFRVTYFITGAISYDEVDDPKVFEEAGRAFGEFQRDLSDFDGESLYETIPHFHDTLSRYETFEKAVLEDKAHRAKKVQDVIEEFRKHKQIAVLFAELQQNGTLPIRVTHNDTKLNNVMIDEFSGKGLCVLDLDTVMPGLSYFDFGDAVRYGANKAGEDERDFSKVGIDLELYEAFAKGFVSGLEGKLLPAEIDHLADGAMCMAFELGLRFLTDYLNGDVYFKASYPESNLDKAKVQLTLLKDMIAHEKEMRGIIQKLNR